MAKSFEALRRDMSEAGEVLRSFTLGQKGFTQRDGVEAIARVTNLCDRLQEHFGSGRHAREVANTVVMARNRILAAKARLAVVQSREAVATVPTRTSS